ncbi:MAG: hypothetical protein JWO13_2288 [Acidobacteriales bacterium]|nr:hypothetical protein [Terriglobales bacterium]
MISYPLVPPSLPAPNRIRMTRRNLIGRAASPFSGVQQVQEWPGEWWEMSVSYAPGLLRPDAEKVIAFLLAARGGTFYFGDTAATSSQAGGANYFTVKGASQSGRQLVVKNAIPGVLIYKAGDNLSLGAGGLGADAATQVIAASGGGALTIYYEGLAAAVVGTTYVTTLRVEDTGAGGFTGVKLKDNLGGSIDFSAVGADGLLQLVTTSAVTSPYRIQIVVPAGFFLSGFYAWGACMQRAGVVENLVPVANRNLTGWINLSGATTGYTKRFHKVLKDVYGVALGGGIAGGIVDISPALRPGPMNDGDIVSSGGISSPKPVGLFRLADNSVTYDIGTAMEYGLSFNAVEAI